MSKYRVLSSVPLEFRGENPATELLEEAGFAVEVRPPIDRSWSDVVETTDKLADIAAFIAGGEFINAETLAKADDLKIVARNGVGFDRVDLEACTARGILVTNTPGAMSDAVADHALALLLATVRSIVPGDRSVKEGGYDVPIGQDLAAMTLGLVGCGRIGAEVVRRARGFKMRVLVHDPWVEAETIAAMDATPATLDELLAQADAISLHTPLTDDNVRMVNADFLGRMQAGSYLINTARGGLVDEEALIAALKSGHLTGAGLDCQETEPPEGTSLELVRLENVVAMPHSASKTYAARGAMSVAAAQNVIQALQGKVPDNVVNKEVLEKLNLER